MKRLAFVVSAVALLLTALAIPATGSDKPYATSDLNVFTAKLGTPSVLVEAPLRGNTGGSFSKQQIAKLTCTSSGNPAASVDMSCPEDEETWGDYSPDNEIAIAVDPRNGDHLLAGSNDYFYRFNNANGARQALVPTGFFTSFDGGATWLDGQIPMRIGNGAGDPVPAFNAAYATEEYGSLALMAQLENTAGAGGFWVSNGSVTVSRSTDGGTTWEPPVMVFKGQGAGIGPANHAVFWDKEWMTVDNNEDSPNFGRIYVTATRFRNGLHGSYTDSPIFLSYSDDGGLSWSTPQEISGSHASCTFQSVPPSDTKCDEDQFSVPVVAPDGTLYVHFHNYQNEAEWEVGDLFDAQIMVVRSNDGGETFADPVPVAQLEDGLADMPYSVIGRQTVWGHQIRWTSAGSMAVAPDGTLAVVWSDRGAPNGNPAVAGGCIAEAPAAPDYDPCHAGPGAEISVRYSTSPDGGLTWTAPAAVDPSGTNQWFPWVGYQSDNTMVVAWDEDTTPAPADIFRHVLFDGSTTDPLGPTFEHIDESLTHWAGQYTTAWPAICGPDGSSEPGKACNVFHGDYTGLAVGPDNSINVVWTGLNVWATSAQVDFYTGELWSGYRQDAMFARR